MPYGTVVADVIQNTTGYSLGAGNASIMKNRIINGAMVIDQRNAGASVATTTTGSNTYTLDRWSYVVSQASKFTIQQNAGSVTPPAGFTNYLGCTSTSAYSITSTDYFVISQQVEGYNVADLDFGKSTAKTFTLSFWVRSSLTGTFGGSLVNGAYNYSYPFTYTISSPNTWEQKSITVVGPTAGTWYTTNGVGIIVEFGLGVGSTYSGTAGAWVGSNNNSATGATSVVGTNGATWYITGVQLEVGSSATGFEYRQYTTELTLCQRYFYLAGKGDGSGAQKALCSGGFLSSAQPEGVITFPVTMRGSPSLYTTSVAGGYIAEYAPSLSVTFSAFSIYAATANYALIYNGSAAGTVGYYARLAIVGSSTGTVVGFSAEL